MPTCRDNRKRRQKRRHRDLLRLAARRIANRVYRATGKSPRYYLVRVYGLHKVGQRYSCRYCCIPRPECVQLLNHLARMVENIPVPQECLKAIRDDDV